MSNLNDEELRILKALEDDFNQGRPSRKLKTAGWVALSLLGLALLVVSVLIPTGAGILVGSGAFLLMVFSVYKATDNVSFNSISAKHHK